MAGLTEALRKLIRSGAVLPGDGIVYRYTKPDYVNRMIARVQSRALANLGSPAGTLPSSLSSPGATRDANTPAGEPSNTEGGKWKEGMVEDWNGASPNSNIPLVHSPASQFTHAGIVAGPEGTVEVTSPICRECFWDTRLEGIAEAVIVRPAWSEAGLLRAAVRIACAQIGALYPFREILMYWVWSWWFLKFWRGGKFEQVFRSHNRDVCSGSLVRWWLEVGLCHELQGLDRWPEAWYPARLLVEPAKFQIVAVLDGHETHEQHEGK